MRDSTPGFHVVDSAPCGFRSPTHVSDYRAEVRIQFLRESRKRKPAETCWKSNQIFISKGGKIQGDVWESTGVRPLQLRDFATPESYDDSRKFCSPLREYE